MMTTSAANIQLTMIWTLALSFTSFSSGMDLFLLFISLLSASKEIMQKIQKKEINSI